MVLDELLSALAQILVFTLIPFLVYLIRKKTYKGFFSDIGLKRSTAKANGLAFLITVLLAGPVIFMMMSDEGFKEIMLDPKSVSGKINAMGFGLEAVAIILIDSLLKTSLSEEIFFRGFVAKRLIAITNFQTGNIIQAIIFGVLHTLLFMTITDNFLFLFVIFFFPALGAYFKTYLNEKLANGSIFPGWIAHGSANFVAYSVVAFMA